MDKEWTPMTKMEKLKIFFIAAFFLLVCGWRSIYLLNSLRYLEAGLELGLWVVFVIVLANEETLTKKQRQSIFLGVLLNVAIATNMFGEIVNVVRNLYETSGVVRLIVGALGFTICYKIFSKIAAERDTPACKDTFSDKEN